MLTSFIGVFEDKLKMHKNEIKEELQKAKTDRRKAWMKATLKEAKELFGQVDRRIEISAQCIRAREGLFDGS